MLDSSAAELDKLERPEILSQIPSFAGKEVLELGAGIGRFSGVLARKARSVVAVDFVQASCNENRRQNAEQRNLEVLQADVTALHRGRELEFGARVPELPENSWLAGDFLPKTRPVEGEEFISGGRSLRNRASEAVRARIFRPRLLQLALHVSHRRGAREYQAFCTDKVAMSKL